MRYNPPPNWPPPPHEGWQPSEGWEPDPAWGDPPAGWQLWLDDTPAPEAVPAKTSGGRKAVSALKHPVWMSLGTVIAVAGLVLVLVQARQGEPSPAKLEVVAKTMEGVESLAGAYIDITGTYPSEAKQVGAVPIDITLENTGDTDATITGIEVEVVGQEFINNCTSAGAGEGGITAEYALVIPMDDSGELATSASMATEFKVRAGRVDRMLVTVGPAVQSRYGASLITLRVNLVDENGGKVDAGEFVLLTTQDQVDDYIDIATASNMAHPSAVACAEKMTGLLDEALATDAVHSPAVTQLRDVYGKYAA